MKDPLQNGAVPDEELVVRAQDGHSRALDELVRRHHETAFRVAMRILQDSDQAADVVQDAFVKMVSALDSFRGDARFRTWLLTIVANEAKGAIRKSQRRRESAMDDVGPIADGALAVDDGVVGRSEAARVRAFLTRLPEKQRMAVELRIDDGLSFREIGEMIASSEGAARVNFHHGIKKLRELLSEDS